MMNDDDYAMRDIAWREGRDAYFDGRTDPRDNPYQKGTKLRKLWFDGVRYEREADQ
jgi:hypothetical protein